MKAEIETLEDNKTWELVDLPKGKKAIGCRWAYNIKYNASGKVEMFKARLLSRGIVRRKVLTIKRLSHL